ncbi:MAG: UbiA prenyltransferase family protein [Salibacteraceae bacterium]
MSSLKHYLAIARVDHWFKNIFMLPGIVIPWIYVTPELDASLVWKLILGVLAACFIASANYVINEWLDAEFDRYHPVKKHRPSVTQGLKANYVYLEYAAFGIAGLALALIIGKTYFFVALFFLIMGFMYNVRPFRTKDRAYIDVITESINNPIRLTMGWLIISPETFPHSSLLISYWFGGAFLMATKRFSEYRFIDDPKTAGLYRMSFRSYSERSLLVSITFYALVSSFFLAIFLFKHRLELIIAFPFIAMIFAWYLNMGFDEDSPAQRPEKLYKQKSFLFYLLFVVILVVTLLFVDIPFLDVFMK